MLYLSFELFIHFFFVFRIYRYRCFSLYIHFKKLSFNISINLRTLYTSKKIRIDFSDHFPHFSRFFPCAFFLSKVLHNKRTRNNVSYDFYTFITFTFTISVKALWKWIKSRSVIVGTCERSIIAFSHPFCPSWKKYLFNTVI